MAVALLLLAGCGVGAETSPQKLPPDAVPFGLLAPATTTTSTMPTAESGVVVYLDRTQRLVPVSRAVPAPATLQDTLAELDAGPTPSESAQGLTSPISAVAPLRVVTVRAGLASVDVPAGFETLGGQDQIVAAAQLVFTLTGRPGVTGVVLLVDGQPTQVPTAGGSLSQGPLTRASYSSLSPT